MGVNEGKHKVNEEKHRVNEEILIHTERKKWAFSHLLRHDFADFLHSSTLFQHIEMGKTHTKTGVTPYRHEHSSRHIKLYINQL